MSLLVRKVRLWWRVRASVFDSLHWLSWHYREGRWSLRLLVSLHVLEAPLVMLLVLEDSLSGDRAASAHDLLRRLPLGSLPLSYGELHGRELRGLTELDCLFRIVLELVEELVDVVLVTLDFVLELVKLLLELLLELVLDLTDHLFLVSIAPRATRGPAQLVMRADVYRRLVFLEAADRAHEDRRDATANLRRREADFLIVDGVVAAAPGLIIFIGALGEMRNLWT